VTLTSDWHNGGSITCSVITSSNVEDLVVFVVSQLCCESGLWCACSRWITEKTVTIAEACAIDVVVWHN
jgi:hypothetical protein